MSKWQTIDKQNTQSPGPQERPPAMVLSPPLSLGVPGDQVRGAE